jgi:hypothetical protein
MGRNILSIRNALAYCKKFWSTGSGIDFGLSSDFWVVKKRWRCLPPEWGSRVKPINNFTAVSCRVPFWEIYSVVALKVSSGLHYKNMTIVNDATSWSITQVSSITLLELSISRQLCSQRTFIVLASLMVIVIYDCHIFIVQATAYCSIL